MKTYKRRLSNARAAACENAKHPVCRCRCSGALHGKEHADYQTQERMVMDSAKQITAEQVALIVNGIQPRLLLEV